MKCSVSFNILMINTNHSSNLEYFDEYYQFDSIKEALYNSKSEMKSLFDVQLKEDCTLEQLTMFALLKTELDDEINLLIDVDKNGIEVSYNDYGTGIVKMINVSD